MPPTDGAEIWAPRLHPLEPSLVSGSNSSTCGDRILGCRRRRRGRRRLVVYLRGGLCALVSFEEAGMQLGVGESDLCRRQADVIGEKVSGDGSANDTCSSGADIRCCRGEEEQEEGELDCCGVDPAEVGYSRG